MSATPFVLQDSQKVSYAINGTDKDGNPAQLPAGDTILVASADPASASVVPDPTPAAGSIASGFILGGAKLTASVQVTFTAVGSDGVTPDPTITPGALSFNIVAGAATSVGVTLGSPVSQ